MPALDHSLYTVIFTRKSTRSYSDSPIPEDKLETIRAFILEAVPLFPSEEAAFEIQPHKGNTMKIAAYAKNEKDSFINLAFMLQQMDLFIQLNGMGTLWNATVRATKKQHKGLPYGICLIFGMAKESPVRTDTAQFDRKQAGEISDALGLSVVEAVRLAPSARNRQPWYMAHTKGSIEFYSRKGGFIDNTLLKGLHWFDIGIAICHAVLALRKEGLSPVVVVRPDTPEKEGYLYCLSLKY